MKRIGLFFLVLLMLSACGAEQSSGVARSGLAEQEASRLQREAEEAQAKLERERRRARRIAQIEQRQEARQERRREARRLERIAAQEDAEQEAEALAAAPQQNCDYDPCLAPAADYDCAGGSGDGPAYTGYVRVIGSDPYDLDSDGDGVGCES